jgi:outer membrane protein assembly factor BamB
MEAVMKSIRMLVLILCACFLSVAWAQQPARDSRADWTEFLRTNMTRSNPYEHVLSVHNVRHLHLNWTFKTKGQIWSSPAVVNGVVYVGSDDYKLYALDARTGRKLWSYSIALRSWSSPAVANGVVYIGDDQEVYAFGLKKGRE